MPNDKGQLLDLIEQKKAEIISTEGYREYECLVSLVEDGVISSFKELAEYGVENV